MRVLLFMLGMSLLAGSVDGQSQVPNSRNPGDPTSKDVITDKIAKDEKIVKHNWWAARRAFGKRQNKGREALHNFNRDLEQERIVYHKRMIYQIRQARKLEGRHRKRRYANPNYCYPPAKSGRKWKRR